MVHWATLEHRADQEVNATLQDLPEDLRTLAMECRIVLLPEPPADVDPDLLGLFSGASLADSRDAAPASLPRIDLFLGNLWDYADEDPETFRAEVRITLLHELGHYFGWDEEELARRGLD